MGEIETSYKNPLGYEPVSHLLRKFAIPAVISMLVNAIYNIVDQIFIGQGVGYLGNAATTIAFPVVTIVLAAATMLGAGGSSYAAIKLGQGREQEAERTLGNVFLLLVVLGIFIAALGLLFLEPVVTIFGATAKTMDYAKDYTSIILMGVPFSMIGIGLSNMARTDGSPMFSMYSMLAGAILNTVLDPIFIFIFHWGVTGAAIATIISQVVSAIILIGYFIKKGRMRLTKRSLRFSPRICVKAASLGMSSGIMQIAATILQIVMNNSLVYYGDHSNVGGDVALSAMGIVMKVNMILISFCIGIGVGAQPILGFNKGAKQFHRVKRTYLLAVSAASIICVLGWAIFLLFPATILKLFGTADVGFTTFAVKCMRIFLAGVFCAGFQGVSTSYFQATGQPIKASVLSMLRQLIFLIPLLFLLPPFFGLDGILYAGPIADIGAGLVVLIFVLYEMKQLNKRIKEEDTSAKQIPDTAKVAKQSFEPCQVEIKG